MTNPNPARWAHGLQVSREDDNGTIILEYAVAADGSPYIEVRYADWRMGLTLADAARLMEALAFMRGAIQNSTKTCECCGAKKVDWTALRPEKFDGEREL